MDRNQLIGLALMAALWFGYWWYVSPSEEEQAAATEQSETEVAPAQPPSGTVRTGIDTLAYPNPSLLADSLLPADWIAEWGTLAPAVAGERKQIPLENDRVRIAFSSRGGLPQQAALKDFTRYGDGKEVELWDPSASNMDISFAWNGENKPLSALHFEPVARTENAITLEAKGTGGTSIRWEHRLDGHGLQSELTWVGTEASVGDSIALVWTATGMRNEKGLDWERQHSAVYFKEVGQGRDYLSDGREDETTTELPLEWLAFKQNYFSALVAVPDGFAPGAKLQSAPAGSDSSTMVFSAELAMRLGSGNAQSFQFFFGPNELHALESTGLEEAERVIDYGWWIFGWLNRNFVLPLYNLLAGWTPHVGLIILLITLVIKLILSPVTWKNYLSSAKMRVLKPEMDDINAQHKDDAVARQQAMMTLYRETGVNPLAGCIPALLQAPLLYAMFRFFPSNIDLRGKSFLWADDLGAYDSIVDLPFHIPFYGAHISGFTVLMAASTFFYMRLTMAAQPQQIQQPGMPNMQIIQQIFPFMMLFFFNGFAAGLSLYYLVANVISIGQMYAIKAFFIDEEKIRARIDLNKSQPKKKSSFQQRLEEMQAQQQRRTQELKAAKKKKP